MYVELASDAPVVFLNCTLPLVLTVSLSAPASDMIGTTTRYSGLYFSASVAMVSTPLFASALASLPAPRRNTMPSIIVAPNGSASPQFTKLSVANVSHTIFGSSEAASSPLFPASDTLTIS